MPHISLQWGGLLPACHSATSSVIDTAVRSSTAVAFVRSPASFSERSPLTVNERLRWHLGGLICVLQRAVAIPPNTVLHDRLRAARPDDFFNEILFLTISGETGFSGVLYGKANTGSAFSDSCFRIGLTLGDCKLLRLTPAGRCICDAFSAHTRSDAVPNNMDDCVGGQAHEVEPFKLR